MRSGCILAGCILGLAIAIVPALPQTSIAPTIRFDGILNAASRMHSSLPGGSVAPGSLVEIDGWRLTDATVHFTQDKTTVAVTPVSTSENKILAALPLAFKPGPAEVVAIHGGLHSEPQTFQVAASSLGLFSQNGDGWGPARTGAQPVRPRERVRLFGTGLGNATEPPRVWVGGKRASGVRLTGRVAETEGIEFGVPADAPTGCFVPVLMEAGRPRVISNVVTLAIRNGDGPCEDAHNWLHRTLSQQPRNGLVALFRSATRVELVNSSFLDILSDGVFASFHQSSGGGHMGRFSMLPPAGACSSYVGRRSPRSMLSLSVAMEFMDGRTLDAGPALTVRGDGRNETISRQEGRTVTYSGVVGGQGQLPQFSGHPPMLDPGEFALASSGGADVGAFETRVRVRRALVWKNRGSISTIHRSDGVSVEFQRGEPDELVVIVATNTNEQGAAATAVCLVPPGDNRFRVPAGAFANFPTDTSEGGLPLNLLIVASLPPVAPAAIQARGIDAVVAMFVSASMRTVIYR